jgi:DNA repair protein RecN (Recombination protein N)
LELPDRNTLPIRRVVSKSGRNRAFINGRTVNLGTLAAITRGLVDISGQHEHVELTDEETHRDVLDAFGGLVELRSKVGEAVGRYRVLEQELEELTAREKERVEREEFLQFSIRRIDEVKPEPGEDERLKQELLRLKNSEKIVEGLKAALGQLYERDGSTVEQLGQVANRLSGLVQFDPEFRLIHERLEQSLRQVEDLSHDLKSTLRGLDLEPARLEEVEERLMALKGLIRAHGPDLSAVLEKRERMAEELEKLSTLASKKSEQAKLCQAALNKALELARKLSGQRSRVAKKLGRRMVAELESLAMTKARVEVEVLTGEPADLQEWGLDRVRFMLSANPGEDLRPLARVASGGELSRVLLALKAVLSEVDPVPTYVFDEVDSGVGGAVAEVIGAKLSAVSASHQVLCITHLPQIAAFASSHFVVRKKASGKRTVSEVELLPEDQRVEEVARMVGGVEITDEARKHARKLLTAARKSGRRF